MIEGLRRELNVLTIGGQIKSQVDEEIQKKQREYYLREQLKAIREELGEGGDEGAEIARLRLCLEEAKAPDYVMKAAEEQLERLSNIPSASPEYSVILDYLDWLCDVPWSKSTEDHLDLERARKILDEDHYDLTEVKERILEYLAVRKLKADMKGPILCFVGPPGVGKTSLGRSIARAMGREFVRISLGGCATRPRSAATGERTSAPCREGSSSPSSSRGRTTPFSCSTRSTRSARIFAAIVERPAGGPGPRAERLIPRSLPRSVDRPLESPVHRHRQNSRHDPTGAPRRMEIIRLPGYMDREKIHIARQYLVPSSSKKTV